jgi:branched-chain amino acid transport system ATP-binding protein
MDSTTDICLRVDDIHLNFGGVKAITGVGFDVVRSKISSIIGPNGAGKSSMLNVISGFYHPSHGRIIFEGRDRTHLPAHAVARLGFARTFQNIALFKGMTTLDNIMTGRSLKIRGNFLTDALYWGFAQKEEINNANSAKRSSIFWRSRRSARRRSASCRTACKSASSWRARWRWSPRCCCWTSRWRG